MHALLRWTSIVVGLSMFAGTLLSLSRNPHWFVRGRDFPRVQIALLASGAGAVYSRCCSDGVLHDKLFWSATTQFFLRLRGLLDPRVGLVRWPLDHLFHSNHFRLVELRCCGDIGSDHLPVLVDPSYEPEAPAEQPESRAHLADQEEAIERLDAQADAVRSADERSDRT